MNIYLLTHDIWFYTTLLFFIGYIILAGVTLRVIIFMRGARPKTNRQNLPISPMPTPSQSTLRQRLHANNDRP